MTPENRAFLDANRNHYDTLINAGYMRSLSGETRSKMQEIMGQEFQPGYQTDLWCPPCVSDMVTRLYRYYDKWISEQVVIVQTGFPSNKSE